MARTFRKQEKRERPKKVKTDYTKKASVKQQSYYYETDDEKYD